MRKPMVTRSFETMVCTVMCLNVTTKEVTNKDITLSRVITDGKKLENTLREICNKSDDKFVTMVGNTTVIKLFGMSEADFLKYSVELDPETRKVLEKEEDETEDETEDEAEDEETAEA